MLRVLFFFFLVVLLHVRCENTHTHLPISEDDIVIPQNYVVHKTKPLNIDGLPTESEWQNTNFTSYFEDIEGGKKLKPYYDTKVKMLWDDKYLYVYARLTEEHIWGDITKRDEVIFYNNNFEVFINPANDTYAYGEIEVNALNTVWDLLLNQPYSRGGKAINAWNLDGFKSAVHTKGTLNNPNDKDEYWAIEMAIPMSALVEIKQPHNLPKNEEIWRINFSRVEWQHEIVNGKYARKKEQGKYLPEYNWVWSAQNEINMHLPEMWGYIQFSTLQPQDIEFKQIDDVISKQVAYAVYKKVLKGQIPRLKNLSSGDKVSFETFTIQGIRFQSTYYKTVYGFEVTIENLQNKNKFVIDTDGYLKQINH